MYAKYAKLHQKISLLKSANIVMIYAKILNFGSEMNEKRIYLRCSVNN